MKQDFNQEFQRCSITKDDLKKTSLIEVTEPKLNEANESHLSTDLISSKLK